MEATFLYDGDCAFCTRCARFAERWVPTRAVIVPWQLADLAALGVAEAACAGAVQWVAPGAPPLAGPDAIAALLGTSHRGWRLVGRVLRLRPVRALAWPGYRWVARHRHRMPGGTAACAVPSPTTTPVDHEPRSMAGGSTWFDPHDRPASRPAGERPRPGR